MAAKQFIRPEIIFVFIRVHSWLKTFRPSGSRATKSVGIRKIKRNHVGAGFPRPIASITDPGGENPPLRWIAWLRENLDSVNSARRRQTLASMVAGRAHFRKAALYRITLVGAEIRTLNAHRLDR